MNIPAPIAAQPKKKHRKWPWAVGAVVVVIIAISAANGGSKSNTAKVLATSGVPSVSAAAPAQPPAAIGTTLQINEDGDVSAVTLTAFGPAAASQFADIKGTLYAATVTFQGQTGKTNVNPMWFAARAADGTNIDVSLGAVDNQIDATDVTPGEKLTGSVGFDVPAGERITKIVLQTPLGDSEGVWTVAP